jgi:hypothetical protein
MTTSDLPDIGTGRGETARCIQREKSLATFQLVTRECGG